MKGVWKVVHDCDLEDGTPTLWALNVAVGKFYWIDALADGSFDIIDHDALTIKKNCKSLKSAKRWVKLNLL